MEWILILFGGVLGLMFSIVLDVVVIRFQQFRAAQSQPPKKKKWKVQVTAPDGYPLRYYTVEGEEVHRLMAIMHHDHKDTD